MPFDIELIYQAILIGYMVTSPFLFMWFHKIILKETWNNDLADKVTVQLYVMSNLAAVYTSYLIQECQKCQ